MALSLRRLELGVGSGGGGGGGGGDALSALKTSLDDILSGEEYIYFIGDDPANMFQDKAKTTPADIDGQNVQAITMHANVLDPDYEDTGTNNFTMDTMIDGRLGLTQTGSLSEVIAPADGSSNMSNQTAHSIITVMDLTNWPATPTYVPWVMRDGGSSGYTLEILDKTQFRTFAGSFHTTTSLSFDGVLAISCIRSAPNDSHYINGVQVGSTAASGSRTPDVNDNIEIRSRSGGIEAFLLIVEGVITAQQHSDIIDALGDYYTFS